MPIISVNYLKRPHFTFIVLLDGIYPDCYKSVFTNFTASGRSGRLQITINSKFQQSAFQAWFITHTIEGPRKFTGKWSIMGASISIASEDMGRASKVYWLWVYVLHKRCTMPNYWQSSKQLYMKAHIEQVLHDHFLFRKLTESQCHVLLDCMRRVDVKPGDIVVQQVITFWCWLSQ
jgi:hypothetical protein